MAKRKRKRRPRVPIACKVEPLVPVVIKVDKPIRGSSGMLNAAAQRSARSMEEDEAAEQGEYKEAKKGWDRRYRGKPEKDCPAPPREPQKSLRVYERKHLWAWLHQATDQVLKELYTTVMDKHGMSELGEMLRQYFTMRGRCPNNPLSAEACPFCKCSKQSQDGAG